MVKIINSVFIAELQSCNCVRRWENATPNLRYFVALGQTMVIGLCISTSISLDFRTLKALLPSKFFSVHVNFEISSVINFPFGLALNRSCIYYFLAVLLLGEPALFPRCAE